MNMKFSIHFMDGSSIRFPRDVTEGQFCSYWRIEDGVLVVMDNLGDEYYFSPHCWKEVINHRAQ